MCKITSKIFLIVTAILFWIAAIFLGAIGGTTFYEYKNYQKIAESTHVLVPASIFLAVAVFLFLLGIIGCVGAYKEQKCLLGFFFIILAAIFVGLITATGLSVHYKDDVEKAIQDGMNTGLQEYGSDKTWTEDINFIQKELKCCGVANYTDWLDTPWQKNHSDQLYPNSCCEHNHCNYNHTGTNSTETGVYEKGCSTKMHNIVYDHFLVLLGVAAALAVFQLIGMIASCVLLCQRRSQVPYIGLGEPSGLRV